MCMCQALCLGSEDALRAAQLLARQQAHGDPSSSLSRLLRSFASHFALPLKLVSTMEDCLRAESRLRPSMEQVSYRLTQLLSQCEQQWVVTQHQYEQQQQLLMQGQSFA